MSENRKSIGVLDSGVGGLTVVKELQHLLPDEDIVYYGDNKNCPYGNRTAENIVDIARDIIRFLQGKQVKVVVLACNTTSSLLPRFQADFPLPIFSVIQPAASYVVAAGIKSVGVIGTELTIQTGSYEKAIHALDTQVAVHGEPSQHLARLVDRGDFAMDEINAEVAEHLHRLMRGGGVADIIYGCTHYPIVGDVFERLAPDVRFINPAKVQAQEVARYLAQHNLQNDAPRHSFTIYTSGTEALYRSILERLGISTPANIHLL